MLFETVRVSVILSVGQYTEKLPQAREQNPFLERFTNDWATEELVKQFIKNKRGNHYRNGWLDVPEKYSHLKKNSLKRDQSGSRKKKAFYNADASSSVALAKKRSTKRSEIMSKGKQKMGQLRVMGSSSGDEEDREINEMNRGSSEPGP